MRGDTRSLDYSSYEVMRVSEAHASFYHTTWEVLSDVRAEVFFPDDYARQTKMTTRPARILKGSLVPSCHFFENCKTLRSFSGFSITNHHEETGAAWGVEPFA